ncbi:MAG: hypothetical protein PHT12_00390 [Patescibacteria group bacterium]|nr:hypothetical protein [Patescibacteria group bacterium]
MITIEVDALVLFILQDANRVSIRQLNEIKTRVQRKYAESPDWVYVEVVTNALVSFTNRWHDAFEWTDGIIRRTRPLTGTERSAIPTLFEMNVPSPIREDVTQIIDEVMSDPRLRD